MLSESAGLCDSGSYGEKVCADSFGPESLNFRYGENRSYGFNVFEREIDIFERWLMHSQSSSIFTYESSSLGIIALLTLSRRF